MARAPDPDVPHDEHKDAGWFHGSEFV
jgi:hypothetical protein